MADVFEAIESERWIPLNPATETKGYAQVMAQRISDVQKLTENPIIMECHIKHEASLDCIADAIKSASPEDIFSFDQLSDWADRNGYTRDEGDYK
jgi:hypothetical protein